MTRTVVCRGNAPPSIEPPPVSTVAVEMVIGLSGAWGVRYALEHALHAGDTEGAARLVGRETPAMQLERLALSTARVA